MKFWDSKEGITWRQPFGRMLKINLKIDYGAIFKIKFVDQLWRSITSEISFEDQNPRYHLEDLNWSTKTNVFYETLQRLNVSTTPLRQWGFRQCLPFSWTRLRGKHCRHPITVMGVVDTFGSGKGFLVLFGPYKWL